MWDGQARGRRRVLGRLVLGLVEEGSRGEKKEVEDSSMSAIYLVLGEEEERDCSSYIQHYLR